MNTRGTIALFLFMMFIVFILLGLALANPLTQSVGEFKNSSEINCSVASTYQEKANCTSMDTFPFLYVGLAFGLGFVLIKAFGRG